MKILGKREPIALLVGDLIVLTASLWLTLLLRNLEMPPATLFYEHLVPFSILFVIWVVIFYIAGLYGKHTVILKSRLPSILLNTQLSNSLLAVVFFYFIPFFGITPKTILFIYLGVSFLTVLAWRMYGHRLLGRKKVESAVLIGRGPEAEELMKEVNGNDIYGLRFVSEMKDASIVVADFADEEIRSILPDLYERIFSGVNFVDLYRVYEDVFDRVPLSLLRYDWFLKNISTIPKASYDALKRMMDMLFSAAGLLITGPFFPLIALIIKLDSPGPAFIIQERFGQNNRIIRLYKFRSMKGSDEGKWLTDGDRRVTRVGAFLRRSRIDELPQLYNVLNGDISLIGPRPDIYALGVKLQEEIPYYSVRNIIKPGLSGWAQISQDVVPHSVEDTKIRLAYDLYYVKNRSLFLDLQIALRTIKTLASRVGR